jgi:hypothetical protein
MAFAGHQHREPEQQRCSTRSCSNRSATQGYSDNQASLTSTVQDALGEQFSSAASSTSSSTRGRQQRGAERNDHVLRRAANLAAIAISTSTARQVVVRMHRRSPAASAVPTSVSKPRNRHRDRRQQHHDQVNQLSSKIASAQPADHAELQASGTSANNLRDTREQDIESTLQPRQHHRDKRRATARSVSLADNPSVVFVSGASTATAQARRKA